MRRALLVAALFAAGCPRGSTQDSRPPQPVDTLPGHGGVGQDTAPKEPERLVPAEALIRTYLQLFGGLSPLAAQAAARRNDGSGLFDTWDDYLFAVGLPDYRNELPRGTQTNALMVATFERIGIALCDRSVERDRTLPLAQRVIFAFDPPPAPITEAAFAPRFDVLHRTFLGYPAALAPTDRTARFFQLYRDVSGRRAAPDAGSSRFTPAEAGWAAVCYGLVRHPEFHVY